MTAIFQCQAGERRRDLLRLQLTVSQGGRWRSSVKLATHFRMMCERDVAGWRSVLDGHRRHSIYLVELSLS